MKRFGQLFMTVLLFLGVLAARPAAVEAHVQECSGQGRMTFSGPGTSGSFRIFLTSQCAGTSGTGGLFSATGFATGVCPLVTGSGVANGHHSFSFVTTTATLVITGSATGTLTFVEDPFSPGSCLANTDTEFLVSGTVAMT